MEFEDALDRIGGATLIIGAGFVIGSVLEYGVKAVLARYLGPDTYGVFVQGLAVMEILAVIGLLGLHRGLPRFMSYYRGKGDAGAVEDSIATASAIAVAGGIVVSVVMYAGAPVIATLFNEPALESVLRLFTVAVLPLALFYLSIAMIRGVQNARYKVYVADVILPLVQIALILFLFWQGFGVEGAVYAYIIAVSLAAIIAVRYFRSLTSYGWGDVRARARELVVFSWPLMVVSVVIAVNRWVDVLMLGWLSESAAVGIYEVAMSVAGFSIIILSSLNYMYMPVVSELFSTKGREMVGEAFLTTTRWVYLLSLPVLAGLMIFPDAVLTLLFGEAYAVGSMAMIILAVGYLYSMAVGPAGTTLMAIGLSTRFMAGMIVLGVVDIALNLVLIPPYGIVGAAIAMSTGTILANAVMAGFVYRHVHVHPFTRTMLRPSLAMLVAAVPMWLLTQAYELSVPVSVGLGVVMVGVYGIVLYRLGGIREKDVAVLRRLFQQRTGG